jgi:hypothetical protein
VLTVSDWPLGIIHLAPPEAREKLMDLIKDEWRTGRISLWAYANDSTRKRERVIYSEGLDLNWISKSSRGKVPGFSELEYYCEVGVYFDPEGRRPGTIAQLTKGPYDDCLDDLIDVEISYEDLEHVCTLVFGAAALSYALPEIIAKPELAEQPAAELKPPVNRRASRRKPFWDKAEAKIDKYLDDNGCPETGDGGQARLEDYVESLLDERRWSASRSTIRKHVKQRIAARLACLASLVDPGSSK